MSPRILELLHELQRLLASEPGHDAPAVEAAALIDAHLLHERALAMLRNGVRIRDPKSLQIRGDLTCGAGVEIDINVIFEGAVELADGVTIGAHSIIKDARIGRHTTVKPFSLVEGASVGADSLVGPYARIRPGSTIDDAVQIGNFVEITRSQVGSRCRINHHSFIGDAELAEQVTVGAGTITCNHDGVGNTRTVIERGAYIGSGCSLVAPVRIGEGATVGAGSTITRDVPPGTLTLARARQTTVEGWQGLTRRRPQP